MKKDLATVLFELFGVDCPDDAIKAIKAMHEENQRHKRQKITADEFLNIVNEGKAFVDSSDSIEARQKHGILHDCPMCCGSGVVDDQEAFEKQIKDAERFAFLRGLNLFRLETTKPCKWTTQDGQNFFSNLLISVNGTAFSGRETLEKTIDEAMEFFKNSEK